MGCYGKLPQVFTYGVSALMEPQSGYRVFGCTELVAFDFVDTYDNYRILEVVALNDRPHAEMLTEGSVQEPPKFREARVYLEPYIRNRVSVVSGASGLLQQVAWSFERVGANGPC